MKKTLIIGGLLSLASAAQAAVPVEFTTALTAIEGHVTDYVGALAPFVATVLGTVLTISAIIIGFRLMLRLLRGAK